MIDTMIITDKHENELNDHAIDSSIQSKLDTLKSGMAKWINNEHTG